MTDSAKLTHVVDVVIGKNMFDRMKGGQPMTLGFEQINVMFKMAFDPEVITTLTPDDEPKAEEKAKIPPPKLAK